MGINYIMPYILILKQMTGIHRKLPVVPNPRSNKRHPRPQPYQQGHEYRRSSRHKKYLQISATHVGCECGSVSHVSQNKTQFMYNVYYTLNDIIHTHNVQLCIQFNARKLYNHNICACRNSHYLVKHHNPDHVVYTTTHS